MARRARRALGMAAVAVSVAVAAACGSSASTSSLTGTRAPGEAAPASASTSAATAPAGSTTSVAGPSDVTLGGASQVTGGSGATSTTPQTTVPIVASTPSGFQRAADPEGTVSVAVPAAWTIVPLDDRTLEELANQAGSFPAATRQQLQQAVAQAGQYMKVLAVGPPDATGFSPSVNVIVSPGAAPLSTLKAIYPKQAETIGATVVTLGEMQVDGRVALRVTLRVPAAGGGQVDSTQLVVPAEARTVIVSYTAVDAALLDQMITAIVMPRR